MKRSERITADEATKQFREIRRVLEAEFSNPGHHFLCEICAHQIAAAGEIFFRCVEYGIINMVEQDKKIFSTIWRFLSRMRQFIKRAGVQLQLPEPLQFALHNQAFIAFIRGHFIWGMAQDWCKSQNPTSFMHLSRDSGGYLIFKYESMRAHSLPDIQLGINDSVVAAEFTNMLKWYLQELPMDQAEILERVRLTEALATLNVLLDLIENRVVISKTAYERPANLIGSKEIEQVHKVPRSTLEGWEHQDNIQPEKDPVTGENLYPRPWFDERKSVYKPRRPKKY